MVCPVYDPEKISRGRIAGPSMILAVENATKDIRPPGHNRTSRSKKEQMNEFVLKEEIKYDRFYLRSSLQQRSETRCDAVITRQELFNIVEVLLLQKAF